MKRLALAILLAAIAVPAWAASGTLTTSASTCSATGVTCLIVPLSQDKGAAGLTVSGTWTGTITFEASADGGTTWTAINAFPLNSGTAVTTTTGNGNWQVNAAGLTTIRMRASATMTGSAIVTITPSFASARSNGSGGGGSPGGSAGGDLGGTYPNPTVTSLAHVTGAIPNGVTATTQTVGDNTTKVATDAFVLANVPAAAKYVSGYPFIASTSSSPSAGALRTLVPIIPASNSTVNACYLYVGTAAGKFQLAIYDSDGSGGVPSTKICGDNTGVSEVANSWNADTITGCGTLTANHVYWLTFNIDTGGTYRYESLGLSYFQTSISFGTFPATFVNGGSAANQFSAYCNLTGS